MLIQPLLGPGGRIGDPLIPLPAAWECDLATDALRWSPGVYDLFGVPRSEPLTRDDVIGMYTPESQALLEEVRTNAVAQGASFTIDVAIRRRDGELRKMRLTADVQFENGKPVLLYGTKQDVTDE
ncbi:PAS domain-containing protein [Sphingomonas sp.]|uniref:PAS domain-containing protein n=1 Tax=Sphingomonas sp. TaxID=28214 RepID=UPI002FDA9B91